MVCRLCWNWLHRCAQIWLWLLHKFVKVWLLGVFFQKLVECWFTYGQLTLATLSRLLWWARLIRTWFRNFRTWRFWRWLYFSFHNWLSDYWRLSDFLFGWRFQNMFYWILSHLFCFSFLVTFPLKNLCTLELLTRWEDHFETSTLVECAGWGEEVSIDRGQEQLFKVDFWTEHWFELLADHFE